MTEVLPTSHVAVAVTEMLSTTDAAPAEVMGRPERGPTESAAASTRRETAPLTEPIAVALPVTPLESAGTDGAAVAPPSPPAAAPGVAGGAAPVAPAGNGPARTRTLVIVGATLAVLALASGIIIKIAGSRGGAAASRTTTAGAATTAPTSTATTAPATTAALPAGATTAATTTATTTATTVSTTAPPTTPATTVPVDPRQAALSQLEALERTDRPLIDAALVGHWVPQLSAKQEGVVWNGVAFDLPAILDEHLALRSRYQAVVIRGSELNFNLDGSWFVTIVPQPFDSGEGALAWCRNAGIGREDCFAKLVTSDLSIKRTVMANK